LQDADRLQHMIRYASAAGALTTLRPGAMAAQPLAAEVDAFLYLQSSPEPES
jgi:fructokinase